MSRLRDTFEFMHDAARPRGRCDDGDEHVVILVFSASVSSARALICMTCKASLDEMRRS